MSTKVKLPSNGRVYPSGLKEVELRQMTLADEKYLYSSSNSDDDMIKRCIESPEDININDLIVADKVFLLVKLRQLTFGDEFKVPLKCPKCGKEFDHIIKLSELEVNDLDDDYEEPITITLPVSKDIIGIRLPRVYEVNRLVSKIKSIKSSDNSSGDLGEFLFIYEASLGVVSVNGEELLDDELYVYISNLHSRDGEYLKTKVNEISNKVGIDTLAEITCPNKKCGHKMNYNIPINTNFFRTTL